jgi:hypothetical protein
VNGPRPVAIGYICGADDFLVKRQHADVTRYIEAEGLALAEMLHDKGDGFTISQIVQAAQLRHATQVVLPADARLVVARNRLTDDLAEHGAVCVVLDRRDPENADPGAAVRPVAILARSRPAGPRTTEAIS